MTTYLITGISGFVAGHYLEYLASHKPDAKIVGVDERPPSLDSLDDISRKSIVFHQLSLRDADRIETLISKIRPDYIVHLASYSSVAHSWIDPVPCFVNNTNIFLNIIEAVRKLRLQPRILSVGSSEEYGIVNEKDIPITEETRLNPISPYAVARVSQELLSLLYAQSYGLQIVCTRSFNHIGTRQRDTFAVSSFAKQIIEIKRGGELRYPAAISV